MWIDIFGLATSLGIILASCELFTNSIEWFGKRLKVGDGVVGSVFSAVGTCLPETMVPVIAILFSGGGKQEVDIGIGAIAGAPFMLGTLGFFLTGASILIFHKRRSNGFSVNVNTQIIKRDIGFFIMVYTIGIAAAFTGRLDIRTAIAVFLVFCYVFYLYRTFSGDRTARYQLEELYMSRMFNIRPRFRVILLQIVMALTGVIFGAHIFVLFIRSASVSFGIPALVLSLVITPVATELPEKFNSIIWISKKKDTLALGNITGAMVFQSCIPVSIGLSATSWELGTEVVVSAALVIASALLLYIWLKLWNKLNFMVLLAGGFFYVLFLAFLIRS